VENPKGKRPLGRPRCRWVDGIRIDFMESGLGGCGLDSTGSYATELVSWIKFEL
jgi:hypothetical protein